MENKDGQTYCEVCSKCVIDFTGYSNAEIIKSLVGSETEVCGRISQIQLNQLNYYLVVAPANRNWMKYLGVLAIGVSIFTQDVQATTPKKPMDIAKTIAGKGLKEDDPKIIIKFYGYVFLGKDKPAARMRLRLKNTAITTLTDINGRYEIEIDDNFDRRYNTLITEDSTYVTSFNINFNSPKQNDYYPSKLQQNFLGGISISDFRTPPIKKSKNY